MSQVQQKVKVQFQKEFRPEKYVDNFYSEINVWEKFLLTHLHNAEREGKLRGPRAIDIGCGPIVHRMAILARVCDVILASDYTDANRQYVQQWLTSNDLDQAHKAMFKFVAKLEGYKNEDAGVKALESRARSKVKSVISCDVTSPQPIGDVSQHGGLFDMIFANGCLDSACLTYPDYLNALRNVTTLIKPGGVLILGGYMKGDFYYVGDSKFMSLNWNGDMVRKSLEESGFKVDVLEVYSKGIPEEFHDNCGLNEHFFSLSYKL